MSEEAKQTFINTPPYAVRRSVDWATLSIDQEREAVDNWYRPQAERAKAVYPVNIEAQEIAGIGIEVVVPKQGVSPRNRDRVLINLHGGGYSYAAGGSLARLTEAIPIAGVGKIKVVTVDYRTSPQHKFPAAIEDVTAVYRALLSRYKPENVGIYGCSTGATLTANVIAWLQKERLPRPGAIGLFCEGATKDDQLEGDSYYFSQAMMGDSIPAPGESLPPEPYMEGTDPRDPLVAPVVSLEILSKFPPTLLITGTRDLALSAVVHTHARLVKAGVDADLHVWDGMWHAFFFDVALPESQEAYDVITKFFDKHLGQRQ
jgi:acetyl esterase/lipase